MLDVLKKMFGRDIRPSKDIARERLSLVLIHDRASVSPQLMEILKDDMIKVISKYMDINDKEMEISLTQDQSSVALVANIPVARMKHGSHKHE
jgi:cell division topological specificity factor